MKPLTLALSGGGAKCAAHAGVLAVLAEARLPVGALAGVSAGGLVAALHGLGFSPWAIRDYFADTHLLEVWEFDAAGQAIFGMHKVRARLREAVGDKTFADLALPVTIVTVDLTTRRQVWLSSGRLDEALLATMAIPGLFTPLQAAGQRLADGGVVNPLPVDVARRLGPRVVAVDLLDHQAPVQLFEARGPMRYATEIGRRLKLTGLVETVYEAVNCTVAELTARSLAAHPPDVLLRPNVGPVGLFAFDLAPEAYARGEAAARAALPQLTQLARRRFDSPARWAGRLAAAWQSLSGQPNARAIQSPQDDVRA